MNEYQKILELYVPEIADHSTWLFAQIIPDIEFLHSFSQGLILSSLNPKQSRHTTKIIKGQWEQRSQGYDSRLHAIITDDNLFGKELRRVFSVF